MIIIIILQRKFLKKVCNDIIKLGVNNDLMKGTVYLDKDKTDQPQKNRIRRKK